MLMTVLVLSAAALVMGMGGLGGVPEGTVPKTDENIKVRISDRSGVTTELNEFSMDGNVFLDGRLGDGKMDIFFRDLREVAFGQVSGDEVPVELLLKSGSRLQLKMRKRAVFYGNTGYGAYRITARDVNRIIVVE
jgi:hypothetical protein